MKKTRLRRTLEDRLLVLSLEEEEAERRGLAWLNRQRKKRKDYAKGYG